MAKQEQDREDLIREATALVERVELAIDDGEPVVVGFRRTGCGSVFFGGEPVYQFNTQGELRRAFAEGRLYKAEGRHLVSLARQRTAGEVQLLRHELTIEETARFLEQMQSNLRELSEAISSGEGRVLRQVPENMDILARVSSWVTDVQTTPIIAQSPHSH